MQKKHIPVVEGQVVIDKSAAKVCLEKLAVPIPGCYGRAGGVNPHFLKIESACAKEITVVV